MSCYFAFVAKFIFKDEQKVVVCVCVYMCVCVCICVCVCVGGGGGGGGVHMYVCVRLPMIFICAVNMTLYACVTGVSHMHMNMYRREFTIHCNC